MNWIEYVIWWYGVLLLLGLLFLPLTKKLFPSFIDAAYPFSKTIAIIVATYAAFIGGILHLFSFTQTNLMILVGVLGIGNFFLGRSFIRKKWLSPFSWRLILIEEILFFASLLFLAFIRSQEPSIRGLEKFMDFGFMQSILRSNYFPPLDMWLSADPSHPHGYPINYYYFGHLSGALLIKLSGIPATVGYNLILASIFAQGMTLIFSLITNIASKIHPRLLLVVAFGLIGSFIVNLAGNLHTMYLFTKGYAADSPVPFWEIIGTYNPANYWYPNATRFIPLTIHEFPSYSYVVADLHGHVFDIPFVILTISMLFVIFTQHRTLNLLPRVAILGFLTAVHYMTNAFDGPIYVLLTIIVLWLLFKLTRQFLILSATLIGAFVLFSFPFSYFFSPFVSGIGVNCGFSLAGGIEEVRKIGPFLFEQGKCQISAPWMLFILWGFFWVSFTLLFLLIMERVKKSTPLPPIDTFAVLLFTFGTFLIIVPEFFYIKDIYPAHFRANTMFKLGYQAFIMMGIAATYTLIRLKSTQPSIIHALYKGIYVFFFFFIFLYPFYSFPSYYGNLQRTPRLEGSQWLTASYPEDKEIIEFLNRTVKGQPVILEAQGDSYTDFERISAYTGLPTVAGWWVHEWLWRGSSDVVGTRIPEVAAIYESTDLVTTYNLLRKYQIAYVIVSTQEKNKYPHLQEDKFSRVGHKIFESENRRGAIYQVD